jgi:hypothetical protein
MSEPKPREWFQARLRWAVMEEGHGLDHWREAEHFFLSENREMAFQEALRLGGQEEMSLLPGERGDMGVIDYRVAEVVYLEELGRGRTAFEVYLGEKEAHEKIGFDHQFNPAERVPPTIF